MSEEDKDFLDEFLPSGVQLDQQSLWESQTLEKRIELQNLAKWYKLAIDEQVNSISALAAAPAIIRWKSKLELLEQLFGEYLYKEL